MDFLAHCRRKANTVELADGRRVGRHAGIARGDGPRGPPLPALVVGGDVRTLPIPETSLGSGASSGPSRAHPGGAPAAVRWDRISRPSGKNRLTPADKVRHPTVLRPRDDSPGSPAPGDGPQGPPSGRPTRSKNKVSGQRPSTPPPRGSVTEDMPEESRVQSPGRGSSFLDSPRFPQGLTRPPGSRGPSPGPLEGSYYWHREQEERREAEARQARHEQLWGSQPPGRAQSSTSGWRPQAPPRTNRDRGNRDPAPRERDRGNRAAPRDRDHPAPRDRDRGSHTRQTRPRHR